MLNLKLFLIFVCKHIHAKKKSKIKAQTVINFTSLLYVKKSYNNLSNVIGNSRMRFPVA